MKKFSIKESPSQAGKIAIVTGANDGIGFETTLGLVEKGAKLIMACRNPKKAEIAMENIIEKFPDADLTYIQLDLSSLNSVKSFVSEFKKKHQKLDLLINNAGIMVPPFSKTEDGFESQMGVNYFSHFLLTGLLMTELNAADSARVISLSSIAHKPGKINFENLNSEQKYSKMGAYSQSKLACLMFAYELDRKLRASGSKVISVAVHPGASPTNLMQHLPAFANKVLIPLVKGLFNTPQSAAMPTLMAAMDPLVKGGDYFGPKGFAEMSGEPALAKSKPHSHDEVIADKLWVTSESLVDFKFNIL